MRLKPGQTAPQMPPRGPKGPITNPGGVLAAGNPRTPRDIGSGNRPKGGIGMTGGPKPELLQQPAAQQAAQQRAQSAATMTGGPRAVNTGPRTPPPSTNVNPFRPRGAGAAPQKMQGLGAAMAGPKVGLGTGMGMNKMAGAGAALGKAFGAKKGGAVGASKMGKVKTSSKIDGVATKGKTKGTMVKMTKRG